MGLGVREAAELLGIPRRTAFRWIAFLPRFAERHKYLPFPDLTLKDLTLLALIAEIRQMGNPLRTAVKAIERVHAEWNGLGPPSGNLLIADGEVEYGKWTLIAEGTSHQLVFWPGLVRLGKLMDRMTLLLDEWEASDDSEPKA